MLRRSTKIQLVLFVFITLIGVSYVSAEYVGLTKGLFGSQRLHGQRRLPRLRRHLQQRRGHLPRRHRRPGRCADDHADGGARRAEPQQLLEARRSPRRPRPTSPTGRSSASSTSTSCRRTTTGPYLSSGQIIPASRNHIPVSTQTLLVNLDRFVRSVNTDDPGHDGPGTRQRVQRQGPGPRRAARRLAGAADRGAAEPAHDPGPDRLVADGAADPARRGPGAGQLHAQPEPAQPAVEVERRRHPQPARQRAGRPGDDRVVRARQPHRPRASPSPTSPPAGSCWSAAPPASARSSSCTRPWRPAASRCCTPTASATSAWTSACRTTRRTAATRARARRATRAPRSAIRATSRPQAPNTSAQCTAAASSGTNVRGSQNAPGGDPISTAGGQVAYPRVSTSDTVHIGSTGSTPSGLGDRSWLTLLTNGLH